MSIIRATDGRVAAPRTIALFIPTLIAAGAERVAMNLGRALVASGHRVDLVVADVRGKLPNQIPDGVRLVDLKSSRVLTSLVPLARYLRRERPAALISFMDH